MPSRVRAFAIHLLGSALVIAGLLTLVCVFWYPSPYFGYEGAVAPLRVLIGVDLVLGPLLTLLVYKPGKRFLWLDMTLIIALQLGAFGYGTYALWSQRPIVLAFAVDSFSLIPAADLKGKELPEWLLQSRSLRGPAPVYAEPKGGNYAMQVLLEGAPDIDELPEQYRPLEENREAVLERGTSLIELAQTSPAAAEALAKVPEELREMTLAVPVHGRLYSGSVLVSKATGMPEYHLELDLYAALAARAIQMQAEEAEVETPE